MKVYKVIEEGSDEDDHWGNVQTYSNFQNALERFNKIYDDIMYDVNQNKNDDDEPDIEKTLVYFYIYVESMGYYTERVTIEEEELDSGISYRVSEETAKKLCEEIGIKNNTQNRKIFWPGMEEVSHE